MIHSFKGKKPNIHEGVFVAWNAEVEGDVNLAEGSSVWYGAVLRADIASIRVGKNSNIQDGTVVHVAHGIDCVLGEGVTVGHGAIIHACTIGNHSLIGMGAIILDQAEIGAESIVGAGALVTQGKIFPPRSMILGSPAKVVRSLSDAEAKNLHDHAEDYARLAAETREGLREEGPSRG